MVSRRALSLVLAGCAFSVVAEPAILPNTATAQSTLTNVAPLPQRRIEPQRRRTPQSTTSVDDPDLPSAAPARPRADDTGEPAEAADARDGEDPRRAAQQLNRDGEPQPGGADTPAQVGAEQVGETVLQRDGEPDLERDPRLKEDIDAFERPAAGYDALAFQIDDIDPLLDRRPSRLARFEPYDPVGIRRGSWLILPEVELALGATSNVRRSPSADGAAFGESRASVRAVTDWRQHAIELKATGFASTFGGFSSENDSAYTLEARGRLDLSRRTNVEVLVTHQRDQDSRQSRDAVDSAIGRANILTNRAAAAFNHRFNRLTVQLRGSVTDVDYAGVAINTGGFASNAQRDVVEYGNGARASWAFKPTLAVFTDVSTNDRNYKVAPADGIRRDSRGIRAVAGVSFGSTSQIWRGEIAVGYGSQRPDDARLSDVGGLIFDANIAYRVSELTSLLVTARTDFNDSTTPGQSGSRAQTFGLEARHAFRRHLLATASLRSTGTTYRGVALDERETTAELGVDYYLNRTTTLSARYTHVDFGTSTPGGDYAVDTVRFGVRIRQ